MEVELAKTAGFCFGVKRAVETVYQEIKKNEGARIYTYGPIIHNDEVIRDLKQQGVEVLNTLEELEGLTEGTVVIRSHGVPESVCSLLENKPIRYVDATCPFVKKIHQIVRKESSKGAHVVIIGNGSHPEVMGIRGWAVGPVDIIQNAREAEDFFLENKGQKVCVVSQTTFNYNKFKDLVEIIS